MRNSGKTGQGSQNEKRDRQTDGESLLQSLCDCYRAHLLQKDAVRDLLHCGTQVTHAHTEAMQAKA